MWDRRARTPWKLHGVEICAQTLRTKHYSESLVLRFASEEHAQFVDQDCASFMSWYYKYSSYSPFPSLSFQSFHCQLYLPHTITESAHHTSPFHIKLYPRSDLCTMPIPKIAIIGAGPGGLTLARLLQLNEIPCTIYEAETGRDVRNQGGTLDLHPKAGQRALQEAGLLEEFKKHARPEGEAMKLIKYDGTVLVRIIDSFFSHHPPPPPPPPRPPI